VFEKPVLPSSGKGKYLIWWNPYTELFSVTGQDSDINLLLYALETRSYPWTVTGNEILK
jgi:hypothetical protein